MVHQGELESSSTAEIRLVGWKDRALASVPVPAETPSRLTLQGLPLLDLAGRSGGRPEPLDISVSTYQSENL